MRSTPGVSVLDVRQQSAQRSTRRTATAAIAAARSQTYSQHKCLSPRPPPPTSSSPLQPRLGVDQNYPSLPLELGLNEAIERLHICEVVQLRRSIDDGASK